MDCTHKEAVHLGEKVTLNMLQSYHWSVGMADSSAEWWTHTDGDVTRVKREKRHAIPSAGHWFHYRFLLARDGYDFF